MIGELLGKKVRVGINGFGRIGRGFMRLAAKDKGVQVVGINDLGDLDNLAYLLQYDTVYREFPLTVRHDKGQLVVGGKKIPFYSERDPKSLPWGDLDVDVVIESTGVFETYKDARMHLEAGARRVVLTAPPKDEPPPGLQGATVLMGVNEERLRTCDITSNASCTTNAGSPLIAILDETLGIESALLNTVHAYTATQSIVDSPAKKDFRRGRAAAQNIIPSTTGAATAVTKAYPALSGRFDGIAMRVPVVSGSIVDLTFIAKKNTSADEVNLMLEAAAADSRWADIFTTTREQIVSGDIIGSPYAAIADLSFTKVIGRLVKVLAWYDNEAGYAHTLLRHVKALGKHARS